MDGVRVGIGRRRRHGIHAMFVMCVLLLIISGATRAAADDPTPDANPSPDDASASPSSSSSAVTPAVSQPTLSRRFMQALRRSPRREPAVVQ